MPARAVRVRLHREPAAGRAECGAEGGSAGPEKCPRPALARVPLSAVLVGPRGDVDRAGGVGPPHDGGHPMTREPYTLAAPVRILEALEVHDPEGRHLARVYALAEHTGHLELLRRLNGWAERSRSGRWRFPYWVAHGPGAVRTALPEAGPVARLPSVDGTGARWEPLTGGPGSAPVLTGAERERVHALFVAAVHRPRPPLAASAPRAWCPREDFNERTAWADVLAPAGWTLQADGGSEGWAFWTRPAGFLRAQQMAVTGLDPSGARLCAYGAHTAPFEPWAYYDRFTAYALLNYGGDVCAASAALAAQGYGPPPTRAAV